MIRIVSQDENLEDAREISQMVDRFVEENVPSARQAQEILDERAREAGDNQ